MSDLLISPTEADIRQALNAFYERHRPRHTPTYVDGIAVGETMNGSDITGYYFGDIVRYLVEAHAARSELMSRNPVNWRWPRSDEAAANTLALPDRFSCLFSKSGNEYSPKPIVCSYVINQGLELLRESRKAPAPYFAITREGQRIIKQLGMDWFRTRVFEPQKLHGKLIGKGSEGNVYRIQLCGRALALKLFSEEAQRRMESIGNMMRSVHHAPIFTKRLGWTRALLAELRDFPLQYADLTYPREYAANASFVLSDLVKGTELHHVLAAAELLPPYLRGSRRRGERCIRRWHIRKNAIAQLEEEILALEAAVTVLQNTRGSFLSRVRGQVDFARSNILIAGYCRYSDRFRLSIIDQGQLPPSFYIADADLVEHARTVEHRRAWELLASREPTRRWLEKRDVPATIEPFHSVA